MSIKKKTASESTADQLHSVAVHLLRRLRTADQAAGLSAQRLSALSVIVFGGPMTLGGLAAQERVTPPTMTRIVNALEESRLVEKRAAGGDRRLVHLYATMKGKRLLIEGRNRRAQSLAAQIDRLDKQEQATLRAAIQVLNRMLRTE